MGIGRPPDKLENSTSFPILTWSRKESRVMVDHALLDHAMLKFKQNFLTWAKLITLKNEVDKVLEHLQKVYESGNFVGLYDAVALSIHLNRPLPQWAGNGALDTFVEFIKPDTNKKRGRHSHWLTKYKEDLIDYIRADTVKLHREHYGVLSELVFEAALLTLCTDNPGAAKAESAGAIKKSYERYLKRVKENPYRYYWSRCLFIKDLEPGCYITAIDWPNKKASTEFDGMRKENRLKGKTKN